MNLTFSFDRVRGVHRIEVNVGLLLVKLICLININLPPDNFGVVWSTVGLVAVEDRQILAVVVNERLDHCRCLQVDLVL